MQLGLLALAVVLDGMIILTHSLVLLVILLKYLQVVQLSFVSHQVLLEQFHGTLLFHTQQIFKHQSTVINT
jgi:hypothetical protein